MVICDRVRVLREEKRLSLGDIEKRTGLMSCYLSRVENVHTVPTVETLEKMARALEVPLYRLFYDGEAPRNLRIFPSARQPMTSPSGAPATDARYLSNLLRVLARTAERDRKLLLSMAQKLAWKRNGRKSIAG